MSAENLLLKERSSDTANGLSMHGQDFACAFVDPNAPQRARQKQSSLPRIAVFVTAALVFIIGMAVLLHYFNQDGTLQVFELVLCLTTAGLLAWESLAATTAILGCLTKTTKHVENATKDMDVAILLPLFGEDAASAIDNTIALLRSLSAQLHHHFSLYVLSDTREKTKLDIEREILVNVQYRFPLLNVFYHHRPLNTDYKAGNIKAWIERDGARHDAVLVLDADSVMTTEAVLQMVDQLASDNSCGLIQTLPKIIRASSFWQWSQCFATTVYGQLLGRGMSSWMGDEGNYYGHNAIIRTKAFAACAGLPRLRAGDEAEECIMSHDFVEAALLRRAGWSVQFAPDIEGSYETTPLTLMGFITRDARWCYGNLQHLRILGAAGLHPLSRWHLFHGAMTYLTSILWLITLVLWGAAGPATRSSDQNLFFMLPLAVATLVLTPKLVGFSSQLANRANRQNSWAFTGNFLLELLASTFIAPTLMIHRMVVITRYATGVRCVWSQKSEAKPTFRDTLRFHMVELVVGMTCAALVGVGILSIHLFPVVFCLMLAPFFSYITSIQSKLPFVID